jgi:uncharacterized protein YifN (PemK superfamily)
MIQIRTIHQVMKMAPEMMKVREIVLIRVSRMKIPAMIMMPETTPTQTMIPQVVAQIRMILQMKILTQEMTPVQTMKMAPEMMKVILTQVTIQA